MFKLTNVVKYCRPVYYMYYFVMSFFVAILKMFVKPDNNLILFNSFGGRKFDDSPKVIFDEIKNDARFSDYRLIWAFHNPDSFDVNGAKKIKTNSISYFLTALKARVWITNSSVERGLSFKGKDTFYLNTWHGTPIKCMGKDITKGNTSFKSKNSKGSNFDSMNCQGEYERKLFSEAFGIEKNRFLEVGLPRNDILSNYSEREIINIKKKLEIPLEKKVILYAPTFREYERDKFGCVMVPPMDIKLWEKELSYDYVLLFRAHYEVAQIMDFQDNRFILNMTDYPSLNELMIVSDILISDYSSIFFDFSITGKPMYHFSYDYEKYNSLRGMYFDIRSYLDGSDKEENLIEILKKVDVKKPSQKTENFKKEFINYYGDSTKKTVNFLYDNISVNNK